MTKKNLKQVIVFVVLTIFSKFALSQNTLSQYTLDAGDVIQITVFGQQDLSINTRVSNTGTLKYPFLGEISLIGKTVEELESLVDTGLRGDYLVNPSVSVRVVEYRPFFIDGEVRKPGGYPYQPGLSFDKAVALAGGYTERANKLIVVVKRKADGVSVEYEFSNADVVLPGDIITISSRFF